MRGAIPQNPVSKPTEKQVLSLLKAAESENGPTDSSITCRVFIIAMPSSRVSVLNDVCGDDGIDGDNDWRVGLRSDALCSACRSQGDRHDGDIVSRVPQMPPSCSVLSYREVFHPIQASRHAKLRRGTAR